MPEPEPTPMSKRLSNKEIVRMLKEATAAMEVKGYNFFRIRAYQNAISVLDNLTSSIYDLWENHQLGEIPGVGPNITEHLTDLFTKGKIAEFEQVMHGLPQGMFALIGLRGIGAKKAFKLATAFKLADRDTALEKIREHAEKHEIQELDGFGEKSEADILDAISQAKMTKNQKVRMLLVRAEEIVERLVTYMRKLPEVDRVEAAGSYRRRSPTVGDLDLIVATKTPEKVLAHFLQFPEIAEILVKGDKKASVVLTNDVQVDIRVSEPQAFGAMLQYSTGSKQHNIVLRNFALEKRLSLSEYGIKNLREEGEPPLEFSTEEDFYKKLGLPYFAPELRQGLGEIEAAVNGKLPRLIDLQDIKGDIHTHTIASDGINTLGEMVKAAESLGYEYIGVSDHAPSVQSRGLAEVKELIMRTRKQIDTMNESQSKIKVLFGYEVSILADATLALPNDYLQMLDYVIASIHTAFEQDRATMTHRIITALENPYVTVWGHPSGRLINQREPINVDWNKIFETAYDNGKVIEINSQPNRLDISDDLVREALRRKIKLIISTDAHEAEQLLYMKYGIDDARRGWCEKKDIVNTLEFGEFCRALGVRNW